MRNSTHNVISRASLLIVLALGLAACGGGGSGGVDSTGSSSLATSGSSGSTASNSSTSSSGSTASSSSRTGNFSLSWTAPTTRADGSPISLADIDGYRIYYGTSKGNYPQKVNLINGTATSATVKNLPVGTYYLRMTTYDSAGRESARSPEVTKSVL
ncbi:MAG: fibronectin type III domain-containing protein [Gammaproteobacteria bacterium]|nr:fibronectin type III domain-containing protein [Gammaproteobacteria bacterium]